MASSFRVHIVKVFPAGVCGGDQPEGELEENWCVPAAQEDERAGGGRATGEALKVKSLIVTSSTDSGVPWQAKA